MTLIFGLTRAPANPPADPVEATRAAIASAHTACAKSTKHQILEARRADQAAEVEAAATELRALIAASKAAGREDFRAVNAADQKHHAAIAAGAGTKAELRAERQARADRIDDALADHTSALSGELIALLDRADRIVEALDLLAHQRVQAGGQYSPVPRIYADDLRTFARRLIRP